LTPEPKKTKWLTSKRLSISTRIFENERADLGILQEKYHYTFDLLFDWFEISRMTTIDIERPKIDCLSFVMCPLLAQLKTGFFFFAAAVYSTKEANKASLKQSIILRCL
jgi:hypothetical protein